MPIIVKVGEQVTQKRELESHVMVSSRRLRAPSPNRDRAGAVVGSLLMESRILRLAGSNCLNNLIRSI